MQNDFLTQNVVLFLEANILLSICEKIKADSN